MLCTDCLHVGEPDTRLEGSDRVELIAWACLALPGLLYCWWRHLCREKTCPLCGSGALMRESRASAARRAPPAPAFSGPRVYSPSGTGFAWPRQLVSPRGRLRAGSVAALASALALVAWLLGVLELTAADHALHVAAAGWLVCTLWVGRQIHQIARARSRLIGCEAWDESGRPLHIEAL